MPPPQVDDRVGRRVVLAPRACARTCASDLAAQRGRAPAASDSSRCGSGRAPPWRWVERHRCAAAARSSAGGTSRSTSPSASALSGRSVLAGEHQVHRGGRRRSGARQRTVPPNPGWMPSITSGRPSDRLRIVDADAIAAGERELEPAAEAKPLIAATVGQGSARGARRIAARPARSGSASLGRADLRELLDVGAGDEARSSRTRSRGRAAAAARARSSRASSSSSTSRDSDVGGGPARSSVSQATPSASTVERPVPDVVARGHRCRSGGGAFACLSTRKSQISGRWSEKRTSGISNESISMPRE